MTDLRRASEEIEENYRRLRVAEAQARAESDRLNLIIDSVADPIVVTDAGGATSLMNEPAERLFTTRMPASALAAALGSGKRRAFLLVHRWHARERRPAPCRRDRTDGSGERRRDAGRGDRRQDPVGARGADGRRHHPARSTRGARKGQAVRAVEAGVRRARTQDSGGDGRHRAAERAAPPAGDRARAGVGAQVAVPREHVARVPHAAERDARLHVDAAARSGRPGGQRREATAVAHRIERSPSAGDHQRDSRHLADRSRPDAAAALAVQYPGSRRRGEGGARTDHHAVEAHRRPRPAERPQADSRAIARR